MVNTVRRLSLAVAAALVLSSAASGYYHYIHFASRFGPYVPIPEKYDLTALKNNTVYYFISDQGPTQLATGDTMPGLISQIRLAAKTWNDVGSSDLRIAFGGVSSINTPQNTPGIDIVFDDDIPPGVNALGGVLSVGSMVTPPNGAAFFPITRGVVKVRRDLYSSPSYAERLFRTLVHEIGHSLGLQHTLTSSVMSTEITRATTRSKPLAADDVAAISILYPSGSFLSRTGTLTGQVTMEGAGVNMASVVAISPNGASISTLSNPDGAYTLQGIPPGSYYVYAHPLPPAYTGENTPANIKPPQDNNGDPIPMTGYFTTQFYPGSRDPNSAITVSVNAGETKDSINFDVQRRAAPALSSITVYGYYGRNAVYPAPILGTGTGSTLVAAGVGLVPGVNQIAPGLNVGVLAASGASVRPGSARYYSDPYMQFYVAPGIAWAPGPRHLLFSTQDDVYVLPASLLLVANQGPAISSVDPATDDKGGRAAVIAGANFDAATRIFFDGAQATILRQNPDGTLLVTPPPALPGHRANVVGLNADGQSSLFTQPNGGPAYLYDSSDTAPSISVVVPPSLAAGSESVVEIDGINTNFLDGQTAVGFGSSDVAVRQIWVTGPNRILLNVSISPSAVPAQTSITVATGLELVQAPQAFQITPAPAKPAVVMVPPIVDAIALTPGAAAGAPALLNVTNLSTSPGTLALNVGGQNASIFSADKGQILFQVPPGLPVGPAILQLQTQSGDVIQPVLMNINPPPPVVLGGLTGSGKVLDSAHPAAAGTIVGLYLFGFPESILTADPSSIKINVGGLDHSAFSVGAAAGGVLVQFTLSADVKSGAQVPVYVTYSGVTSATSTIPIQ